MGAECSGFSLPCPGRVYPGSSPSRPREFSEDPYLSGFTGRERVWPQVRWVPETGELASWYAWLYVDFSATFISPKAPPLQ